MSRISKKQIKQIQEFYGHGLGNCKVRILHAFGEVRIFGSVSDTDRSKDFWRFAGYANDILRDIGAHERAEQEQLDHDIERLYGY